MGNIVILGPRWSGKTTYLAGLAYWPTRGEGQSFEIEAINQDAKKLVGKAKDIIKQKDYLEATKKEETKESIYLFQLDVQKKFSKKELISLTAKDYAGEIWYVIEKTQSVTSKIKDFLDEALKDVVGWLIMLPGWEDEDDNYSGVVEILTKLIDDSDRLEDLRLAVAMSKCERGELWPGRIEPEIDLFQKRLTRTRSILRKKIPRKNLRFYALSTFGVLDPERDPRPNRISIPGDKEGAVLRYPGLWKPYNMIAPLYWLNTGKRLGGNV